MTKAIIEILLKIVELMPTYVKLCSKKNSERILLNFTELFFLLSDLMKTGNKVLKTLSDVQKKITPPTRERLALVQSIIEIQEQRIERIRILLVDPALELVMPDIHLSLNLLMTHKRHGLIEMSYELSGIQHLLKTENQFPSSDAYLSAMFNVYTDILTSHQKKDGLTSLEDLQDNLTTIKELKEHYWNILTELMNVEQKLLIPAQARANADKYSVRQ